MLMLYVNHNMHLTTRIIMLARQNVSGKIYERAATETLSVFDIFRL